MSKSNKGYHKIVIHRPVVELYEFLPQDIGMTDEEVDRLSDAELVQAFLDNVDYLADYYAGTEDTGERELVVRIKKR